MNDNLSMTSGVAPVLVWLRRDMRLRDNPALYHAVATGRPVIPVFLHDPLLSGLGAAATFRFGRALQQFEHALKRAGSGLVLRKGEAVHVLDQLVRETGAKALFWNRNYDPDGIARDTEVKAHFFAQNIEAKSFAGNVLSEPWAISTGGGGHYRVYSPFWRRLSGQPVEAPLPAPERIKAPENWPASDALADWSLDRSMDKAAGIVAQHLLVGEEAAQERLSRFLDKQLPLYAQERDVPARPSTSGLSEPLAYGEISARDIWHQTLLRDGGPPAEKFLKELAWRDFAWHLAFHDPHIFDQPWRTEWQDFDWIEDPEDKNLIAWQQGRTGVPLVDAGMRQLWVTGTMHNRVRMVAASYLTKHLRVHWRLGQSWFADTLIDWDPASNAMGWQWVAGCGPDAAPYFRVFNPETQRQKFDPDEVYTRRWLAERSTTPPPTALSFFDAAPSVWNLRAKAAYPSPVVDLAEGRRAALAALARFKMSQGAHS